MTTYHYRDQGSLAAKHLIEGTSLDWSMNIESINHEAFTLYYDDKKPWSSGEEVLLDLLGSISGRTSAFAVSDMGKLDAETRRVAWEAIGIAAGIEGAKDTGRVRAREEPDGRITLIVAGTPLARIRITDREDHDS